MPQCRRKAPCAPFHPARLFATATLVLGIAAPAAQAATVGTISDQTVSAGNDHSFNVSVSGGSLNTTVSLMRGRYRPSSPGNCNATAMNNAGMEIVPGATVTLPFNFTGGTVDWPREHSTYQVGPHCFRLRACDRRFPFTCDSEYFHVDVTQDGVIHFPIVFTHRDRVVVPGDPAPPRMKLGAWAMRMSPSTPLDELLQLESCPSGYSCSPPSLPSWVNLEATATDGLEFVFDIPQGPAGTFEFTPKIPRLDREVESNDTFLLANVLASTGSTRASVSPSSDVDFYKFYAKAGETFTLRTATSSTNSLSCSTTVDTYMRLYDDDGQTQLSANDASSTNQCSRIIYTPSEDQWFYVSIEEHGQNATISNYYMWLFGTDDLTDASFRLYAVGPEDVTPPQVVADSTLKHFPEREAVNDNNDTAPSLQGSGVVSGAIDPGSDIDRFRFVVGEPTAHSFLVSSPDLGCTFDAVLNIYRHEENGSLTLVESSDDVGASTCPDIPYLELDTGHYLVTLEEDGRNASIYHYLLEHRTTMLDAEPDNNSVSTAWYLNSAGPGQSQSALLSGAVSDYFQVFGAKAPGVFGFVGGPGDASDYYVVSPREHIYAETGDGRGGCPGDTRLTLYRYSVSNTPPAEGGGSLVYITADDSGGVGLCSRLSYAVPASFQNHYFILRVTRDGSGEVGPYLLRYGTEDPQIPSAPDWHEPGFLQAPDFGYDSDALEVEYGDFYGLYARFFRESGADFYAAYDQGSMSNANCDNPLNLYLFTSAELRDGDGVCREFSGERTNVDSSSGWRRTHTVAGPLYSYTPSSSQIGTTAGRAMFGAVKTGNAGANRSDDDNESTGDLSAVELDVVSGGNFFDEAHFGECQGGISGAPPSESTCDVTGDFYEGQYFTFPFRRSNRLTSVQVRRCSSASDASCSQPLEGATYSTSLDEFRWTIPYTFTSSVRNAYFRVTSVGNASRGEEDEVFRLRIRVRHRSSSTSGADLMMERIVEQHPGAYTSVDARANFVATRGYSVSGGVVYDPRTFYRSAYGSASYRSRALAATDALYVHPLFETGDLGDANGPARLEVRIRNRGTATSGFTYIDAIAMPGIFNSTGTYVGPTPNGTEPPVDSAFISSVSAGSSRTAYLDLPTRVLQPQAGALPWDGGPAKALFLRIRSGATHRLQGPYVVTAPPYVPNGFCFLCAIPPDINGGIAAVLPETPQEGTLVAVSFTENYQGTWTGGQPTHRFYVGQEEPPNDTTPYTSQVAGPAAPEGSKTYGGTFTFTATKPDNATNTIPLRIYLNATGGSESNRTNNHLPSFASPYELEIANTPPAFVSAPSTLSATEGSALVRTWTVTDQNAVDRPRLTFAQTSGPTMTVTQSLAPCGGNNSCVTTSFTPTDAQASASPLVASFRVCDGDPVAGGAGACTTHNVTLNITRLNDAPTFTSGVGPGTATENSVYTHQVTATDEETPGSLTYSLVSRPTGMNIGSTTGQITWTPTDTHVPSSNFVRVRVRDVAPSGTTGTRFTDQTWTIAVTNVNDPPVVGTLSPTNGTEGFAFVADASVTDADVDVAGVSQSLSCSLSGAPSFLSSTIVTVGRDRYCRLSGTPDDVDTGTDAFTIRVSDGVTTTNRAASITIANQNEAPQWVSAPGTQNGTQGSQFQITLDATDPDLASPVAGEALTFTQVAGPSAQLSETDTRLTVRWTPGPADAGDAPIFRFRVRDNAGLADFVEVRFNPIANTNDAPYFAPTPPNLAFVEGDVVQGSLNASDPDADAGFSETLSYTIVNAGGLPNLVVDSATGALSLTTPQGRADDEQVGLWTVTVRVEDDESPTPAFVEASFDIDVQNINDPPSIASAAPTEATEDAPFSYVPTLDDPDFPDDHTWTAPGLPAWLQVNASTGAVTSLPGRPNNDDVGNASFTLRVTDDAGAFDEQAISLTVANTNDAPVVTSSALTAATQDTAYSYTLTAADDDLIHGDQLSYSAPTLPAWLSFNSSSRLLSGTPANANVGNHPVVLRVTDDAGAFANQSFTIVVANVNDAPILAPIGSRQVEENATLTFTVSATDPDGTTPVITANNLPTGASFNGTTFSWTPGFGEAGNYTVQFVASDGALVDSEDVIITVGDVNRPPVLAAIGPQAAPENTALTFSVSATDPDSGDTVTLSAVATVGDVFSRGAVFTPSTGAFSWTPDFDDAGSYAVRFEATDGEFVDSEVVTITISNQNRAPAFNTSPLLAATEDAPYVYTASAPDPDGDAVTYSLTTRPAGMAIGDSSGQITWTPTNAQVGTHSVVVRAEDGAGGVDTQTFTIEVADENDLPLFTSSPVLDATEDEAYLYTATASDIDAGDSVTLSAPTLPAWLTFSATTGELAGTPADAEVGDHPVVLRATDTRGGTADQSFTVVVTNVNDAPVFVAPTPSGTLNGAEGDLLSFSVAADDVDGPSLALSIVGLPSGATFDSGTGAFSWTPDFESAGTRTLTLVADDGVVQTTRDIDVTIANTDRPPTIDAPTAASGNEGEAIAFTVTGADPDQDVVTLAMTAGPAGASFDAGTGGFQWTPSFDDAGTIEVSFSATANGLLATTSTSITVGDVNRAPVINSSPVVVATEDEPYTTDVDATDADGDTLTYALTVAPSGATIGATSGIVAWTPSGTQTGAQAFTVEVTDGAGGSTSQSFVVEVTEVNDAPVFTSSPILAATEDVPYVYNAAATDPDDASLTFSVAVGPPTMAIDSASGQVTFTPRNADVGDHPVELLVSDGRGGSDTQAFTLTVTNVNDAPVIAASPAPALTVLQDNAYSFTPAVSDVDAQDTVTLSLTQGPSAMTLQAGTLSWTPGNADVGEHPIEIRATDVAGAVDTLAFTLTVVNRNDAPTFVSASIVRTVNEEEAVVEVVEATDPDVNDTLTYSLVGAPSGASVSATGVLTFTPDDADVGTNVFFVRVEDEAGAFDELQVDLEVLPVNDAPILEPIGNRQVGLGETMEITLVATDADSTTLSYSAQGLPSGATLDANQMTWPTTADDAGAYTVTFEVTDGERSDSETVTLVVGDGGLPPTLNVPADATVAEGERLSATVTAIDPQTSDPVVVEVTGLPTGATFVDGVFDWTPNFDDSGVIEVIFSAANGSGTTTRLWTITVTDENQAPSIDTIALPEALEGELFAFDISAADPDGDALTYSLLSGPSTMGIDENTGTLSFTPTLADAGTSTVEVRVGDGRGGFASQSWPLLVRFVDADGDLLPDTWEVAVGTDPTQDDASEDPDDDGLSNLQEFERGSDPFVSGAPTAPTLLEPFDGARVSTTTPTLRFGESNDPDGDPLTYVVELALASDPGVLMFNEEVVPSDGEGEWTPPSDLVEAETYVWTAVATDGFGFGVSEQWTFVVDAVNEAPPTPTPFAPVDGATVAFASPTFEASRVADPDQDVVTYVFTIRETDQSGAVVATSEPLLAPATGPVAFTPPQAFATGTVLSWTVQAFDPRGGVSAPAPASRVTIDLVNLPPPAPTLVAPADGRLTADAALISVAAVDDPEGAEVTYRFALSSDGSFTPETTEGEEGVLAEDGLATYDATGLAPDGIWRLRVTAFDGVVTSEVTETDIDINFVDVPPTAPLLVAPLDNSEVETQPIELVALAATDEDGDPLVYRAEQMDEDETTVLNTFEMQTRISVDGETEVFVELPLLPSNARVRWRVVAAQENGAHETASEIWAFRVSNQNLRPAAPSFVAPLDGETLLVLDELRFEAAADLEEDPVLHEVEIEDAFGALVFVESGVVANNDGLVVIEVLGVDAPGDYWIRARGRDTVGAGPFAEIAVTIDADAEVDAGVPPDGGVPDGGTDAGLDGGGRPDAGGETIEDGGAPDGPIVTDVGFEPVELGGGCGGCQQTGPELSLAGLALVALATFRRRRRRRAR